MIHSINYAITKGFFMQTEKVYNFLNFLNKTLVKTGCKTNHMYFDLSFPEDVVYIGGATEHKCGEDFITFQKQFDYTDEDIIDIIKYCNSYGYIKGSQYSNMFLTETGREFILNHDGMVTQKQQNPQSSFTVNIQEMHGNNQIGNNNIQNITVENAINCLLEKIESLDETDNMKQEAKGLLRRFLEHPIIAPLASAVLASTFDIKPVF